MQRKIPQEVARDADGDADQNPEREPAIKRPVLRAEFLAANLHRFLPAQVTRLVVDQLRPVRFRRGGRSVALDRLHAFHTTTSFSSLTPYAFSTRSRTAAMSESMSSALALPALTKKFAWRSLTRASPTLKPLRPRSSIMRPADVPGGFLKMQPALFCPSG